LRADHVGAYGATGAQTPTLDRIALEGVRFETAISPVPLTLPTHATLLTGLDPPRHGVRHNGIHRLPEEVETLAERLSAAGFASGAVVGSSILAGRTGLRQGFEFYDDRIEGELERAHVQRRAEDVNVAALRWLGEVSDPFFLFVHYYDPHARYEPPAPFAERFADHPYDGEIAYVDANLGRLLDALRKRNALERTLVVVTADHGESLGEHDELTHSYTVYDATQWVPLLMRGPGLPVGQVAAGIARTADILPTICAWLGMPTPAVDGRDLRELWTGDSPDARTAYVETLATRLDYGWSPLFGVRTGEWLYVRAPRRELYRVRNDPGQQRNLLEPGDEIHTETARDLDRRLAAHRAGERAPERASLDDETLAQLHALGYAVTPEPVAETGDDPKDVLREHRIFLESDELIAAGRHEEAVRNLESLLGRHPASPQGHARLAALLLQAGRTDEALRHGLRAAELRPEAASYWIELGDIHAQRRDTQAAEAAYRRSLAVDPESLTAHVRLVEFLTSGGRAPEAAHYAERAAALAPRDAQVLRRLADAWEKTDDAAGALAWYRRVLDAAPESERDHMHAAIHLARLGRLEESDHHLARAGAVRTQPRARTALAEAYRATGALERAAALRDDGGAASIAPE
jgi:arylsulfatase A-like enzyme/Flp pilus assembly protein TadD